MAQSIWGGQVLLFGPLVALLALRLRGPIRTLPAIGTAIVAEFVSLTLLVVWPFGHLVPRDFVALRSGPDLGRYVAGLALLALYGAAVAGLFVLVQWIIGRLTSAWSRRGV